MSYRPSSRPTPSARTSRPSADRPLVLVATSTFPRWQGDSEPRFVLDLCRALAPDFRFLVVAPHCRGAARRERWDGIDIVRYRYFFERGEQLAYAGGILPNLRASPWLWLLVPCFMIGMIAALTRALRREPVALVHAHWLVPQGVCVRLAVRLSGRRVPVVCTAHGADVFGIRSLWGRFLQRWAARGCARIGAVSEAVRERLVRSGIARARIRHMPMGVAVSGTLPAAVSREPSLIAFAGRIVEKKGVGVLLEAFRLLADRVPDARLCVAGAGPELARYRCEARETLTGGRVEFLGAVPQETVMALFARAAVAVMPSVTARDGDEEGLGLVMLEAMAAGCPVVVSDIPAVRGVIRSGENGLLFPERDAAALADCLERLLGNRELASRLAAAACRDVRARFGWGAVAGVHRAAYAEAMGAT